MWFCKYGRPLYINFQYDLPQGHLDVFGYKSDCSCCTAEKDGTENTGGKGLTGGEADTALIFA